MDNKKSSFENKKCLDYQLADLDFDLLFLILIVICLRYERSKSNKRFENFPK